jgi:hypothetical protein
MSPPDETTDPQPAMRYQQLAHCPTHQLLRQPVVLGREGLLLRRRLPPLHRSVPTTAGAGAAPVGTDAVRVLKMLLVRRSAADAARPLGLRLLLLRRAVSSLLLPPVPPSGESLGFPHGGWQEEKCCPPATCNGIGMFERSCFVASPFFFFFIFMRFDSPFHFHLLKTFFRYHLFFTDRSMIHIAHTYTCCILRLDLHVPYRYYM